MATHANSTTAPEAQLPPDAAPLIAKLELAIQELDEGCACVRALSLTTLCEPGALIWATRHLLDESRAACNAWRDLTDALGLDDNALAEPACDIRWGQRDRGTAT